MELVLKRSRLLDMWEERVLSAGAFFAEIVTEKAQYDRAAVTVLNEMNITVEYPSVSRDGDRITVKIVREIVPVKEVTRVRAYVE